MQNDRIAKTVYVGEGVGIRSVRRQRNRGLGTLKDCLKKYKKRCLDVRQARRIVYDRSEWRGFMRVSAWGVAQGMNP